MLPWRGWGVLRTRHLAFQCLRGLLLLTSSLLAFLSLRYMPVGEFTAIVMMAPLAVTLLAATVLKEKVSALRWTLVAGGFAGMIGHLHGRTSIRDRPLRAGQSERGGCAAARGACR